MTAGRLLWQFAPAILVLLGAVVVAIGGFWSSWRQSNFNATLTQKNNEITRLQLDSANAITGGNSFAYMLLQVPDPKSGSLAIPLFVHCCHLMFGKGGDLKALQALVCQFPENAEIREFHARSLSQFGKHLDAASEYEIAAASAENENDRARLWGHAAAKYAREGRLHIASDIVIKLRLSLLSNEIDEQQFLKAIRQFSDVTKNVDFQIAISERLVDLNPDDFEARFALAYMYSGANNNDLALNHYLKVPRNERSGIHWNNLGVEFQHLNLPTKAVDAYRKSEEANETLAMANLGYKMLGAGLLLEARTICDKALSVQNCHKNVAQLLVRLNEVMAEEDKALEEAIEKSRPKVEFFRCFGRALGLAQPAEIDHVWVSSDCVMNATIEGGRIEITGSYEREMNALSAGLGMLSSLQTVRQRVEYTGVLEGRAIFAKVQKSDNGNSPAASLLSLAGDGKTLMYISDDDSEITVSENPSGAFPKIFTMKRQSSPPVLALSQKC